MLLRTHQGAVVTKEEMRVFRRRAKQGDDDVNNGSEYFPSNPTIYPCQMFR